MCPFPALFILVSVALVCNGLHENSCNVFPKDLYIEAGSIAKIMCQSSCVRGKIFWTLDNRATNDSLSKAINSSHTVLSLRNFTQHVATVQCHSANTQQVLGGTTIRTYSKPGKLSCILHYDHHTTIGLPERFTCSWEHQVDSSLKINYTVLCTSASCPSQSELCHSHETTCSSRYLNIGHIISFTWEYYNVTVRAKSTAWEVSSDNYEFTTLKILKITRPMLNVTPLPDHLLVEWKILTRVSYQYHCQVKYSKDVNKGTAESVLNKTLKERDLGEITIEKVDSCCNYTIVVRCALDEAPWSDWSERKTVLTKLNKRDFKPSLWRVIAGVGGNGVRKVHAMWMEIPSTCKDTFTYSIKETPYKKHMSGENHTHTLCSSSVCDVNQDAHRINLTVFDNESLFVEDSVYVPATGKTSLPRVTNIQTSTLERAIQVSWNAPVQRVSGYMIDYTHDGTQYRWKETKYTNITLLDLLDGKQYNITVTPLFDDKTGYGTQALQICSRVGDPWNVTDVYVQPNHRSAHVSWKVKSQEACSGVVLNYTVFYSAGKGPQLNVTVDGTMQDVTLKDLNPETQYSVYIKAMALTGTTKSDNRSFITKRFDPRLITELSVCGSILIFIVLSLGLCCAIQWKKFKEKLVPNPGCSSVASWPSTSYEKRICSFQPFLNPTESLCDIVFAEEPERTSTSPLATDCNDNPVSDQTEAFADPVITLDPDIQTEDPAEQHPSSPGESTELLLLENSLSSPYRSQSPVETPAQGGAKRYKRLPVKQQENKPPLTVYVTLDMFEQGQSR